MTRLRHNLHIIGAYIRLEAVQTAAYPMAFVLSQLNFFIQPVTFYFISDLVDSGPSVGFDYYTFVVLGSISILIMASALQGFSQQLETVVQNGVFEMLLVEPIPWKVLPFALAAFPVLSRVAIGVFVGFEGVALGADVDLGGVPQGILILTLGIVAAHGIAILACSVKVLSKRGDPIVTVYSIIVTVISGALFPVQLLPGFIRALSYLVPHYYVIVAMRRALMPEGAALEGPSYWECVLGVAVFIVVIYPVALSLYGRALQYGRKMGLLAGY